MNRASLLPEQARTVLGGLLALVMTAGTAGRLEARSSPVPPSGPAEVDLVKGEVFEADGVDQATAEQLFAQAEAAVWFSDLGKVRWLERPKARRFGLAVRPLSLATQTVGEFRASLEQEYPNFRLNAHGGWVLKLPDSIPAPAGAAAEAEARSARPQVPAAPAPAAVVFSEGFENGLGNWTISDTTQGAYKWGTTTCDAHTGSRSADAVRGGSATIGCADPYNVNTETRLTHASCEPIQGASQAWLDLWISSRVTGDDDFFAFYYLDAAGSRYYGYSLWQGSGSWFRLLFDLKQWYGLGDLTSSTYSCPKMMIRFVSGATGTRGFGFRVDDVSVTTDTPSFLRCTVSASPASGPVPLTTTLRAQCTGTTGSETYGWANDDPANWQTSTQAAPTFTYATAGTYSPFVLVARSDGLFEASTKVTAGGAPACTLSCNATVPGTATINQAVSFQGSATPSNCSGSPTYLWNFGYQGQTSTQQSPSFTYSAAGTYSWSLTVSISGASSCTKSGTIVVSSGGGTGIPGDCNGDGQVTIGEVQRAINMLLQVEAPGCNVDVNGDGRVTIDEVQRVINYYLQGGSGGGITVIVSPASVTLQPSATQQFSATVNGTSNTAVTWSVQESGGGTVTAQGLYTAPAAQGTYHVVARSQADTTKSGSATVTVGPQTSQFGVLYGTVKDIRGTVLADVDIKIGTQAAKTNGQGYFTIDNVPAQENALVAFSKTGFVPTTKITKIVVGQGTFLNVNISAADQTSTITGSAGGSVSTSDGGRVDIQPGGLVDATGAPYTGSATVAVTTFDPTDPAQLAAFPGRFEGVTRDGRTIPFVTFGFMDVTITKPDGSKLNLAAGKPATIKIPVNSTILPGAPATLPAWYFDPNDGKWHEDGSFTLAGNIYTATVTHFTIWNCDVGAARCIIKGRVVDALGQPVKCAKVTMLNLGPRGRFTSGEDCTPTDGTFAIPVDANSRVKYWAEKGNVRSAPAGSEPATDTCPDGGEGNIGDIYLSAPAATITLTWGQNPSDLDSHLTIPKSSGTGWDHLYFSDKNPTGSDAKLDTDDTSGYGPEIVSIAKWHAGTYRYSVHHYGGSGTLSTSNANVSLIVEGLGIYNFTPPAGATASKDVWRVFDLIIEPGTFRVTVRQLGDYLHGVSASDATKFTPTP